MSDWLNGVNFNSRRNIINKQKQRRAFFKEESLRKVRIRIESKTLAQIIEEEKPVIKGILSRHKNELLELKNYVNKKGDYSLAQMEFDRLISEFELYSLEIHHSISPSYYQGLRNLHKEVQEKISMGKKIEEEKDYGDKYERLAMAAGF